MNFKEYFTGDDLVALATRIFGNCDHISDDDPDYEEVHCKFKNRDIEFVYEPENNLVDISFFWIEQPADPRGVEGVISQAGKVQAGTMEGIRKFEEFARELKKRGIGVSYTASGKREKIYRKVMQKAGMEITDPWLSAYVWR